MAGFWAKIHKWLALLMAVQILCWFVSGLVMAVVPIERVRSEHAIAKAPPAPVALDQASVGLQRLAAAGVAPGEKVELRAAARAPGRPDRAARGAAAALRPRHGTAAFAHPDDLRGADRRGRPCRRGARRSGSSGSA